jgi:heme-dependent oxidative N-demethylase alpha subunit-like protein
VPLSFTDVVDRPVFSSDPFRWRMGLRALSRERWLQPDDARDADLAEKAALIESRPGEMLAWLPGAESASSELLDLVTADVVGRGLSMAATGDHPIDRAGRSVQEDLCLMERHAARWILTAGSVCFPTRWALADKIGASLSAIHAPVPGYADQLGSRVDRFFDRLQPSSLAWRLNWSIVDDDGRRLDVRDRHPPRDPPNDIGHDLFMRLERQTLRRLNEHEAVVFGIRVHVWPLEEVGDVLRGEGLASSLSSMPLDVADYKSLSDLRPLLLDWIRDL